MNKTIAVLRHMQEKGGITTFEAFSNYGATRLADIVYRLRHKGHEIITIQREQEDRYGTVVKFAEYRLKEEVK